MPLNKPFSTISDPAFTEVTKALEHLQKSSEIQATLPAYRAHKKRSDTSFYRVSNEQTRRNCSKALSSDGPRAKLKSHTTTEDDLVFPQFLFLFVVFFFWSTGTRDSKSANANCPCEKSIKELSILMSAKRRLESLPATKIKAIRVSEILKMNPMLRYFLSLTLKLASNHLHIPAQTEGRTQDQGNSFFPHPDRPSPVNNMFIFFPAVKLVLQSTQLCLRNSCH